MSHTPGPWTFEVFGSGGPYDNPVDVCEITNGHTRIVDAVLIDDARLIAAAPDLLAACEAINAQSSFPNSAGNDAFHKAIGMVRDAIIKAKGEA